MGLVLDFVRVFGRLSRLSHGTSDSQPETSEFRSLKPPKIRSCRVITALFPVPAQPSETDRILGGKGGRDPFAFRYTA